MKKYFSLFLPVLLIFCLCFPAYAADGGLKAVLSQTDESAIHLSTELKVETNSWDLMLVLSLPEGCTVDTTNLVSAESDGDYLLFTDEEPVAVYASEPSFIVFIGESPNIEIDIPLTGTLSGTVSLEAGDSTINGATLSFTSDSVTSVTLGTGSGGTTSTTLTDASFTEPVSGYFSTAGISVTPSTEDLSFTVACDNACVVAKVNDDGSYTRMTGTAVEGGGYSFTATSASDQFVVVVKGDANGDGAANTGDAMAVARACLSDTHEAYQALGNLNACVLDLNGDGLVNTADAMLIARACLSSSHSAYQALTW